MRAVLYEAFSQPPKLANVPDPSAKADGVVLRFGDGRLPQRLARLDGARRRHTPVRARARGLSKRPTRTSGNGSRAIA